MNRLFALVGSTVVAGLVGAVPPAAAQPNASRPVGDDPVRHVARAALGSIEGTVLDERGKPLAGAMVSALGSTSALAVTDGQGLFVLRALPPGAYLVRAHMRGFSPSRRQYVEVWPSGEARFSATLLRVGKVADAPRVLAAGLVPGSDVDPFFADPTAPAADPADTSDDHSERAWRLRHLPRSVLKDTTDRASADSGRSDQGGTGLAHAVGSSARFFTDLPLTGQVNVLTSGSFDALAPGSLSADAAMRSTTNFTVSGPAWRYGDWTARVMTQSDVGSWFLAGSYRNRAPSRNLYDIGFSYSTLPLATTEARWPVAQTEDPSRSAGSIYGLGRFVVSPRLTIDYGAQYSRYDYLDEASLLSPSVTVTLIPLADVRVSGGVSRRMLAPGAEEFLEPLTAGLWVPPERTFVGLTPVVPERTVQYELGVERDLTRQVAVAFRTFTQDTVDQQVAVFGTQLLGVEELQHYAIGDAGDVALRAWSVGISHHFLTRLHGTVAYQVTDGRWAPGSGRAALLLIGIAARPLDERLQGVTTSMETDLPMTATRVTFACKVNTGFARSEQDSTRPGVDSRFDLQVTQPLPFLDFTSARWQVLVAVKNMFRDPTVRDSSVYDELLVVRPPTRILGGVLVRF
jgi:hypothetical protein